ncbi:HEAT repeat domain-containing protein [Candidatus Poribacteria bacterium]|nr:HEAT repeat domain-containing protein [Candidatus Poribacteria bacterium]
MKKFLTICLIFAWVVSFGCKQEQIIPEISPGRTKLLGAGLAVEAVEHLKRAEIEEENKVEAQTLLLIAYSHALSKESALLKTRNLETEYQKERTRRLAELTDSHIRMNFLILKEKHRVQNDVIQILADKGTDVIPLILNDFTENKYRQAHGDFFSILRKIGREGFDKIIPAIENPDIPLSAKANIIQIIGEKGDTSLQQRLEDVKKKIADDGLKMEINAALYRLGNKEYSKQIEAGLTDKHVGVRQAAARSIQLLNKPTSTKLIGALKDTDDTVRKHIVIALQKHINANAVDNLFDILTNDSSDKTKQATVNTLEHYAKNGLASGLAHRLITLLTTTKVVDHKDRIRITQLLGKPSLIEQISNADPYDNLPSKIYDYYDTKEDNTLVKAELNKILLILE